MTEILKLQSKKLILANALLFVLTHCYGQTTVATAGGEAGTMSYTIGQTFVTYFVSDVGSITQGVQQAYTITIVDNVGLTARKITLEAEVYPNPVTDRLVLRVENAEIASLLYTLTDANGRTIAADNITDAQTIIDMSNLLPAVYFLRVSDDDARQTFKIVKE